MPSYDIVVRQGVNYALQLRWFEGSETLDIPDDAVWITDAGPPDAGVGEDGNFYVDTDTYIVYQKVSGAWDDTGLRAVDLDTYQFTMQVRLTPDDPRTLLAPSETNFMLIANEPQAGGLLLQLSDSQTHDIEPVQASYELHAHSLNNPTVTHLLLEGAFTVQASVVREDI